MHHGQENKYKVRIKKAKSQFFGKIKKTAEHLVKLIKTRKKQKQSEELEELPRVFHTFKRSQQDIMNLRT